MTYKLTLEQIKSLLPAAIQNNTLLEYISLLTQWAEQADKEIERLQLLDMQRNFESYKI